MSIRIRLLLAGLALILPALVLFGALMLQSQRRGAELELETRARVLLAAMAASCAPALAENRVEELARFMDQFSHRLSAAADVQELTVIDPNRRIVGHTSSSAYGRVLATDFAVQAAAAATSLLERQGEGSDGSMLVSMPVVTAVHDLPGIRWGTLLARLSLARANIAQEQMLHESLTLLILLVALVGLLMLLLSERLVVRPVTRLAAAATQVRQGNLAVRVGGVGQGEVAALGRVFDEMAGELERHTAHLHGLVAERTSELHAANQELQQTMAQLSAANQRLEELARTDALTGLANHRHMKEALEFHFALARRGHRPLSLAMIDVDHFKQYNDSHGHPEGDKVLRRLAEIVRERVRQTDIACRYGGEEFAILLPDTRLESAARVAEFLRRRVAEHPFPKGEQQPGGKLTISIGVAESSEGMDDPVELVQRADEALYRAKGQGRNQVAVDENEQRAAEALPPAYEGDENERS